jgi:hypothetical protein
VRPAISIDALADFAAYIRTRPSAIVATNPYALLFLAGFASFASARTLIVTYHSTRLWAKVAADVIYRLLWTADCSVFVARKRGTGCVAGVSRRTK